ncbi:hypothetical protein [Aquiflexum sp.]|uniref:hypothetical protein n=1 Tax=Aquiflexum sp. TaxID=1872584 RepID=UPI003593EF15
MELKKSNPWQSVIVWGLLGAMLISMMGFIWSFGSNVPSWDGWDMVPPLTGYQPVTLEWLWSLHNEHRVPLPRLTALLLYSITGINFKIGMVFGVLLITVMTYALIRAASRIRGYTSWTDAFFPLLLLNIGHATNYLWAWQIQYFLSVLFAGILLAVLAQAPRHISEKNTITWMGIGAVALILCGGNGLLIVPPLLTWMVFVLFMPGVAPTLHRGQRIWLAGLVLVAASLTAAYFIGYEGVPYHPVGNRNWAMIHTITQLFTIGLGPGLYLAWPLSGVAALLGLLLGFGLMAKNIPDPNERFRATGLMALLAGLSLLCVAIGHGRDSMSFTSGQFGTGFMFEIRYYLLIVPVWCTLYLIFSIYSPHRFNIYGRGALCITALLLIWPNTQIGFGYGKFLRDNLGAFEKDMLAGLPTHELIVRYGDVLHVNQDILTDYLPMLRESRVGNFVALKQDPIFEEIQLPYNYLTFERAVFQGDTVFTEDYLGYIGFVLPEPLHVNGVMLKFTNSGLKKAAPFRTYFWSSRKMEQNIGYHETKEGYNWINYQPTGDRMNWAKATWLKQDERVPSTTVWMNDMLQEFRIYPDIEPCAFQLIEVKLLVAPKED